jgi:hypothetical protein
MGKLPNPKHEKFCHAVVFNGKKLADAYIDAGFDPNSVIRRNHNRLFRDPRIKARIVELEHVRDLAARAARLPIADVLAELGKHGIDRVADLFEPRPDGSLAARDLRMMRPEATFSLLNALHDGAGLRWNPSAAVQRDDLRHT